MHIVHHLEYGLRIWTELAQRFSQLQDPGLRLPGEPGSDMRQSALVHAPEFRNDLLQNWGSSYDPRRYSLVLDWFDPLLPAQAMPCAVNWSAIPNAVWEWNRCSRRNYHLNGDLPLLLAATTLRGLTWGQFKLPFDSFSITLAEPLVFPARADSTDLERHCDMIIIMRGELQNQTGLHIICLDSRISGFSPWDPGIEQELGEAVRRYKKHHRPFERERAVSLLKQRLNILFMQPQPLCFFIPIREDDELILRQDLGPIRGLTEAATFIAFGTVLYLQHMESNAPNRRYPWVRGPSHPDPNCITDAAQICSVTHTRVLDPELRESILRGMRSGQPIEMSTHNRGGYWRRPRGLGSNPAAIKTRWVGPTVVRRDRRPPGTVPGGSQTNLV